MAEQPCPICGEPNDATARFCSACGVALAAPVIVDVDAIPAGPAADDDRRSLAMLFVPLGVVAALGLFVLVLVSGDDSDDDPEPEAAPELVDAPTATPLPTPTATPFRVTLPESTPPQPTPTRTPAAPQALDVVGADLSLLPPTDATHLAVAHDRDIAFLDLATGAWVLHRRVNLSSVPNRNTLLPFADGVVSNDAESVLYVPANGTPVVIAQGELLGSRGDVLYVRTFTDPGVSEIRGYDTAGDAVDTIELPPRAVPFAMLPTGELVVAAGGSVFLVGEDRTDVLDQAQLLGVAGSKLLLNSCGGELECSIDLLDVAEQTRFELEALSQAEGFPQLVSEDVVVLFDATQQVRVYRIEGTDAVLDDRITQQEANFLMAGFGDAEATDTSGLSVRIEVDRLLFRGPAGDEVATVSLNFLPGFGDSYSLAFVTADT